MQRTRACVCACVFITLQTREKLETERLLDANRASSSCHPFLVSSPLPTASMSNTVITSSPTRSTDDTMNNNKRPDQHDQLQKLLVQKEGEIKHYRDRAEEAEHKLELVTVSRRLQYLLPFYF